MLTDPVPFLGNLALVAYASGEPSPARLAELAKIRTLLGLKKGEFTTALRVAGTGGHDLTPVGLFADQVKNLELMLRVGAADGELGSKELQIIEKFGDAIGILPDQLSRMRIEVASSVGRRTVVCGTCGTENLAGSRFCAQCGAGLGPTPGPSQGAFAPPRPGVAVEFAESTAASFPKALQLARQSPGFETILRGKRIWYFASFPGGSVVDLLPLAEALHGMRNRQLFLNGEQKDWDEVLGFAWCASRRASAYRPMEYCFGKADRFLNPWGCKEARLDWTEWAGWFCHGHWESDGPSGQRPRWRFDKERILHELATNLHHVRFCPHLLPGLSEAVLRHLPDTVVPGVDTSWGFHHSHEGAPGSIKLVEKEGAGEFTLTSEFWADGVTPKGLGLFADLLGQAFDDLGLHSDDARNLIG